MTDDDTPTPTAAAIATGSAKAGTASTIPTGSATTRATSIDKRQAVDAVQSGRAVGRPARRAGRDPVPEDDVRREEPGVGHCETDAERIVDQPHLGQQVDTADGEQQRGTVAHGPGAGGGQRHDRQELDGRDGRQRQPVDRQVEAAVHRGEHRPPGEHQPAGRPVQPCPAAPRPPPGTEHHRRGRDPQPGDAEHVDAHEEQHREGRPEVVEDRAADEPGLRRHPVGHGHQPAAARRPDARCGDRHPFMVDRPTGSRNA